MEVVNFIIYLETKLYDFFFYIAFTGLTVLLLSAAGFQQFHLFLYAGITVCAWLFFQWLRYRRQIMRQEQIMDLTDSLDEAWYAAEVLPKPKELDSEAYYHALKRAWMSWRKNSRITGSILKVLLTRSKCRSELSH